MFRRWKCVAPKLLSLVWWDSAESKKHKGNGEENIEKNKEESYKAGTGRIETKH
jgi:hypothetical protein